MQKQDKVSQSGFRHWQAHVKALGKSGLSRAEYCRRHGLSYHAMTYWHRKLIRTRNALPVLVRVPVHNRDSGTRPTRGSGVTIRLHNGVAVELAEDFSAAALGRVLAVMEAR